MIFSAQYMSERTLPPIGPLLLTVFACILEVFILCFAGWVLARVGILDRKTQKQLNRLNVSLFTPSLLFNKVAFSLSPEKLQELWIIPIFFVGITPNFAIAASAFQNSNSLPIALMQSLVVTVHELKWGKGDTKDSMLGRALTYLVLYSTLGMILWCPSSGPGDEETLAINEQPTETEPLLSEHQEGTAQTAQGSMSRPKSRVSFTVDGDQTPGSSPRAQLSHLPQPPAVLDPSPTLQVPTEQDFARPKAGRRQTTFRDFYSFPATPARSHDNIASLAASTADTPDYNDDASQDDEWGSTQQLLPHAATAPTSSRFQSLIRRAKRRIMRFLKGLNEFMTIQYKHMQPVKGALLNAGSCSIPVTLIVLGAYFYRPKEDTDVATTAGRVSASSSTTLIGNWRDNLRLGSLTKGSEDASKYPGETKTVFIAVLSRMVITPLVLLPLMAVFTTFDVHELFVDPVFVVSIVLLISSPPALTLAQITQAASGDAFERLISIRADSGQALVFSYAYIPPNFVGSCDPSSVCLAPFDVQKKVSTLPLPTTPKNNFLKMEVDSASKDDYSRRDDRDDRDRRNRRDRDRSRSRDRDRDRERDRDRDRDRRDERRRSDYYDDDRRRRHSRSRSGSRSRDRRRSRSPGMRGSRRHRSRSRSRDRERDRFSRSLGGPINADPDEAAEFSKSSKKENRVYVGNLSYDVKYGDLMEFMRGAGEVVFAEVLVTPTGVSKGCGTHEEAQRAIRDLSETPLLGRPIFIREDRESEARFGAPSVPGKMGAAMAHTGYSTLLHVRHLQLPYQAGWQDLKDLFRTAGAIVRADINVGYDGRPKGSGTVIFETAKDAQAAIQMYNGYDWYGRIIEVREDRYAGLSGDEGVAAVVALTVVSVAAAGVWRSRGYGGVSNADYMPIILVLTSKWVSGGFGAMPEPSQQIMVRNLPWSTLNDDLVELFETTGNVEQAEILYDGSRSKGAGVVQFSTVEEAETAIAKFQSYMYGGRPLDVRFNDRWHEFTSSSAKGGQTALA
ncbi:RNA-binding protein [Rhizoctonia solani]|uniref:RNA-binding protein n=1 Tax=Rhizoctonia solani TaxID=456999 RepID=A0A8H7IMD0_9AGAM|nr:RNA-binding protein [Rhizoctonia solani]